MTRFIFYTCTTEKNKLTRKKKKTITFNQDNKDICNSIILQRSNILKHTQGKQIMLKYIISVKSIHQSGNYMYFLFVCLFLFWLSKQTVDKISFKRV